MMGIKHLTHSCINLQQTKWHISGQTRAIVIMNSEAIPHHTNEAQCRRNSLQNTKPKRVIDLWTRLTPERQRLFSILGLIKLAPLSFKSS